LSGSAQAEKAVTLAEKYGQSGAIPAGLDWNSPASGTLPSAFEVKEAGTF
jgi:hypothetical protein